MEIASDRHKFDSPSSRISLVIIAVKPISMGDCGVSVSKKHE